MKIKRYRIIDYYDLIEFPSGRHYPVPKAIREFGWENVLKIPVAEKKRDLRFYFCQKCKEIDCDWCDGYDCDDRSCLAGHSFFKCQRHNDYGVDTGRKKALLEVFFKLGYHDLLKYIEVDPKTPYAKSKGYAIVAECEEIFTGVYLVGEFRHALRVDWDFYSPKFDSLELRKVLREIEKIKGVIR